MEFNIEILASTTPDKDGIIQVATPFLEEYFNVSRKTLAEWEKKGCPKLSRGKWDLIAVLKWRGGLAATNEQETDSEKNIYLRKLKAETFLKEQQGQLAELELQKAKGEVIETSEVMEVVGSVIANAKTLFLSLPSQVAPRLMGVSVLDTLRETLEGHVPAMLKAKSKKEMLAVLHTALEEFSESKTVAEISAIIAQPVHEILEDLAAMPYVPEEEDAS